MIVPALAMALASSSVSLSTATAGGLPPAVLTFTRPVATPSTPWPPPYPVFCRLLASAGQRTWLLHPGTGQLLVFAADDQPLRTIPLPADCDPCRPTSLQLAPVDGKQAWLVDRDGRRAWLWRGEGWAASLRLGEELGGAAALSDGTLVLNTPLGTAAFASYGPDGQLRRRFGSRELPPAPALEAEANSWLLAALPGGELAAVQPFGPLLRLWDSQGALRWERDLVGESPQPELPSSLRAEPVPGQGCCVRATIPRVLTFVGSWGDAAVVVQRAGTDKLLRFSSDGTPLAPLRFAVGPRPSAQAAPGSSPQVVWGVANRGERVWLASERGIEDYVLQALRAAAGRVQGPDGAPVPDARVVLTLGEAVVATLTTDAEGNFSAQLALGEGGVGSVQVHAEGFRPLLLRGDLATLLAEPLVLAPADRYCVRVHAKATGTPVQRFRYRLAPAVRFREAVVVGGGTTVEVEDEAGEGCQLAEWPPPLEVEVRSQGFAPATLTVEEPGTTEVALSLAATLRVQVADSGTGAALAAATVELERQWGQPAGPTRILAATAHTDAEGRATLGELAPGEYRLHVRAPSTLPAVRQLSLSEGDNAVTVEVERGASLGVTVRRAGSRQGVPGSEVRIQGVGDGGLRACTTDGSGSCRVDGLPVGSYTVRASAPGGRSVAERVAIAAAREYEVELELRHGVRVLGEIVGEERYPGATLSVFAQRPGESWTAPAGRDGTFVMDDVTPGELLLWVEDDAHGSTLAVTREHIPATGVHRVVVELPEAVTVTGSVLLGGRPCGQCQVTLARDGVEVEAAPVAAPVQGDGRWQVRLPAAGWYHVEGRDPQSGRATSRHLRLEGETYVELRIEGREVRGVVVRAESLEPVAGARVEVRDKASRLLAQTTSGHGGGFAVALDSSGPHRVIAATHDATGAEEVDLPLPPGATVTVGVRHRSAVTLRPRDQASGAPLAHLAVRVVGPAGEATVWRELQPTAGGEFLVPVFPTAPLTLVVESRGFARVTLPGVRPGEGPVAVPMPPAGHLHLRWRGEQAPCALAVWGADGTPTPLTLEANPGPVPLQVREAVWTGLPPGPHRVAVTPCGQPPVEGWITITPRTITTLELGGTPAASGRH